MTTPPAEDNPPESLPAEVPATTDGQGEAGDLPQSRRPVGKEGEVEQIASLVFARIENKLEHHLHTQLEMPSAEQAADLREKAFEVYQTWIDIARQKAETEAYVQRAQYEVPERLARKWATLGVR